VKTKLGTNLAVNVIYAAELGRLAEKCRAEGILLVAMRGGALLADDFSFAANRHMRDLDLLIYPANETAVTRMILEDDWEPIPSGERCFRKFDPPRYIDLHCELRGVPKSGFRDFLERSKPSGEIPTVNMLAAEDELILNAYHCVVDHGHLDEKWVRDAAILIESRGENLDWRTLAARSKKFGWSAVLKLFLETVARSGKAGIPLELFQVSGGDLLRYDLTRRLIKGAQPSVVRGHIMRLIYFRNPLDALFSIGRILFPDPGFIRQRYGQTTLCGTLKHMLLRPVFVLGKSARLTTGTSLTEVFSPGARERKNN
jgi:hypothetical protein